MSSFSAFAERLCLRFWHNDDGANPLVSRGCRCLDARSFPNPIMVAIDIQRLALRLLDAGVQRVVVCQICRRHRWRWSSFSIVAERVIQVNWYLGLFCDETEGISFWRHKRLWNSIRPVFRNDGVHLSDIGNYRFFRSVRGAIITTVASLVGGVTCRVTCGKIPPHLGLV